MAVRPALLNIVPPPPGAGTDPDAERIVNLQECGIKTLITCPICMAVSLLKQPEYCTACQSYLICKDCVSDLVASNKTTCPTCRQPISFRKARESKELMGILQTAQVKCKFASVFSCDYVGNFQDIESHEALCKGLTCRYCLESITKDTVRDHRCFQAIRSLKQAGKLDSVGLPSLDCLKCKFVVRYPRKCPKCENLSCMGCFEHRVAGQGLVPYKCCCGNEFSEFAEVNRLAISYLNLQQVTCKMCKQQMSYDLIDQHQVRCQRCLICHQEGCTVTTCAPTKQTNAHEVMEIQEEDVVMDSALASSSLPKPIFVRRHRDVTVPLLTTLISSIVSVMSVAVDIFYAFRVQFRRTDLHIAFGSVLGARIFLLAVVGPLYTIKKMSNTPTGGASTQEKIEYRKQGLVLYASVGVCQLLGSYRMLNLNERLPWNNFNKIMAHGYLIEICFLGGLCIIQAFNKNNSNTFELRDFAFLLKAILASDIFLSCYTLGKERNNERARRRYYKIVRNLAVTTFACFALILILVFTLVDYQEFTCQPGMSMDQSFACIDKLDE